MNYIFNSSIKGIEESDLILLIGTNPRYRSYNVKCKNKKGFCSKRCFYIYSIGNPGDLTYDYKL